MFGGNRLSSRTRRRMQGLERKMEEVLRPDFQADELLPIGEDAVHQARYLEHMAHCPVYGNTVTEYFPLGEFCFARMIKELKKAERYIFMEYFIVEEGEMWNAILDILKEKAAQGVDVRFLYDDIGSMFTLPRTMPGPGGQDGHQVLRVQPFRAHPDHPAQQPGPPEDHGH